MFDSPGSGLGRQSFPNTKIINGTVPTVTSGGTKDNWNQTLNWPTAETHYNVDGFHYFTDAQRRVVFAEGELSLDPKKGKALRSERNEYQQGIAGGPDRRPKDQGGHLRGTKFHGIGELLNIVAMHSGLNGSGKNNWWALERTFEEALKAGQPVIIAIKVAYTGNSKRPEKFGVHYRIGNQPIRKVIFYNELRERRNESWGISPIRRRASATTIAAPYHGRHRTHHIDRRPTWDPRTWFTRGGNLRTWFSRNWNPRT